MFNAIVALQITQGSPPESGMRWRATIDVGNPFASVSQSDYGLFLLDDWRIKPNLTFSYGLRYEVQTNAASKYDFAPRIAIAWSPGAGKSARPPKMVIRGGGGIFYNRFSEGSTLTANRFNGVNQQQFSVAEESGRLLPPTIAQQQAPAVAGIYAALNAFSPTSVPSVVGVPATVQTVWQVDPNLQIPTVYVLGAQVERQLPRNVTMFMGRDPNSARDSGARCHRALPGTIIPQISPNGIRPIHACEI